MNSPLVSVVIPTYNCPGRLLLALQSVAAQDYPAQSMEVVVIDDGSTDDTAEHVDFFASTSPLKIRYIRQDNAGPAAARNHGMQTARGDLIAFLDDDDIWRPRKLREQIPRLNARVGLVYCDVDFCDADGNLFDNYPRKIQLHKGDISLPLFNDFFILTSAVVLTKACVSAAGRFDENLPVGEDYEYFLRIARLFHADSVPEKLIVRCVRPGSLSRIDYAKDAMVDLSTLSEFVKKHPDFASNNRLAICKRFASYRYEFGRRLLLDGRRGEAIRELLSSMRARPNRAAAKSLVRAMVTHNRS